MKPTNLWVWALVATLALFVAGCGGGGGAKMGAGETPDPEMTPAEKAETAYDKAKAAEKTVTALRSTMTRMLAEAKVAGNKVSRDTLSTTDDSAKDKAITAAILASGGESLVIEAAAQALVDAQKALEAEKVKADAAKTEAEEAKKALDDLPSDTPDLQVYKDAVAAAIKTIEASIKEIEKLLKGTGSIAELVENKVTGDDEDNPGTPASVAKPIADKFLSGFNKGESFINVGLGYRPVTENQLAEYPEKDVAPDGAGAGRSKAVTMHNAPDFAKTFQEIVGAGNLVKQPFGDSNENVDVLPLDGMPVSSLTDEDGTEKTALPDLATGKAETQYYKGIPGTVHCSGVCYLEGTDMKGDLYFRATGSPHLRFYMAKAEEDDEEDDTHYSEYKDFGIYGYWIREDGVGNPIYTFRPVSRATTYGNTSGTSSATLPATATYKGKALGLSALKTYTGAEHTGTKSGQFTADVTLNATFGSDDKLEGKVNNFKGDAVDENWSVELKSDAGIVSNGFHISSGIATGSIDGAAHNENGSWVGQSFAETADKRPVGIIGSFKAPFRNGGVAGAFATRMATE